ncbi:MAG TPA: hypothetical protein VGO14_00465 [Solirubrobacteraceae bacterium]|jgi:hypothetical protein|nr:hypothetical protein [Solirubrobacteraceae bacterium]
MLIGCAGGGRASRRAPAALIGALATLALAAPAVHAASFQAGAASVDITPPPFTEASDGAFVPACGTSASQVAQLWPGPRSFAFEKPYVDLYGSGRYAPGDPYCDADHTGRYEAPYIAGGSGQNHWPTTVEPGNGPAARVVVLAAGARRVAVVAVDSIGLFNVTIERIRARVAQLDPTLASVFVSSTHDESAPDPIGLWGPDGGDLPNHPPTPTATSSGVDEYYMDFLVERVAHAVVDADGARRPASLMAAAGSMPSNTQSCWSSYPYIDSQSMPVMQARDLSGHVIFTLADVSTHAETLAFSGVPSYISTLSADWPGAMRSALEARWPGSVGVELAGMVGSVETPTVYEPQSTQVVRVPGALHGVAGNPDGCSSVYPEPSSGTPVADAKAFIPAYGQSVADAAAAAIEGGRTVTPTSLQGQQESLCVPLENNLFVAAYAAGLFPDRPRYSDPGCTVQTSTPAAAPAPQPAAGASAEAQASWLKTSVGVLTLGGVQLAYSPGEVFPFTEVRGPISEAQMPFPTDCYEPASENYYCGSPLAMTPWVSAEMTRPYRFLVGLGEDMAGYLFPPGNFVGVEGQVNSQPWLAYESTNKNGGHDRFGHGHADDAESVGPYAGLAVTSALQRLLASDGHGSRTLPGLYLDGAGHLSNSPFPSGSFTGAVGVEVLPSGHPPRKLLIGSGAAGWATSDAQPDPGTAGTALPYSVRTGGVLLGSGQPLLVDVFAGAKALGQ